MEVIPTVFYIHSWYLTPEFMPKVKLSFKDNFITYHNIEKSLSKMSKILKNSRAFRMKEKKLNTRKIKGRRFGN